MKIYIMFRNPFPYGMAPSQHITCEALGLKAAGADVEAIIFSPPFDRNGDDGFPIKGIYREVPYEYIHGKKRPRNIPLQLLNRFWNTVRTFFWGLKKYCEGDIIYSYGGDNLTLMLLTLAAHVKKAKIVVELVEIPFYGDDQISSIRRWFDTKFLFPHFDAFVCISHSLHDFAKKYSKPNVPMLLIPILVEEDNSKEYTQSPYKVPYIIHSGSMSERKDGISNILKGFAEFKKSDTTNCRLVFTGPGANKMTCRYNTLISDLGIKDSVDLLGLLATRKELLNLLHHATMSIVYKVDNIQTRYCFATKIGEILMEGVPLISTNVGEQKFYLRNKENAFIVNTNDEKELAETIHFVLSHPDVAKLVGDTGRSLALSEFNPIYQGKKLNEFFLSL